jgi:pyruvate carboxylase
MPFLYELKLDDAQPEYTLVQHLVPPGTLVGTGQAVALLSDGVMEFHLPAPKQGLLVEWHIEDGAKVNASSSIARIVCEGTEAPVPGAVPERLG